MMFVGLSLIFVGCSQVPDTSQAPNTPTPVSSPTTVTDKTPRAFDVDLDIGVADVGSECSELLIKNKELKPGDEIVVIQADEMPQKTSIAKVVSARECPKSPKSGIEEIVIGKKDDETSKYEIRFKDNEHEDSGFAIVASKATIKITNGIANLTAEGVATPLFFRVCSGNESYHMTVWQGKPLVGERVWHSYFSLSYATDPTCTTSDYR